MLLFVHKFVLPLGFGCSTPKPKVWISPWFKLCNAVESNDHSVVFHRHYDRRARICKSGTSVAGFYDTGSSHHCAASNVIQIYRRLFIDISIRFPYLNCYQALDSLYQKPDLKRVTEPNTLVAGCMSVYEESTRTRPWGPRMLKKNNLDADNES
jgi:hypothetical protein